MNAFDLLLNVEREKAEAIREQTKQSKENTERDIKARNRVDISLEEYERMKTEIKMLTFDNHRLRGFCEKIKLPIDLPIDPNSVEICKRLDESRFRTQYVIRFETDD